MIHTIEIPVWHCTVCDGLWVGRKDRERPERCPKRKCRAGKDAKARKPVEGQKEPLSGGSPFVEAREVEPRWVRDPGYSRQIVAGKKCHCGAKVERVWVPEDEQGYLVCIGIDRHRL